MITIYLSTQFITIIILKLQFKTFFFYLTERSVKYTTESCVKGKDHDEQQAMILHKKEVRGKISTFKKGEFQKD